MPSNTSESFQHTSQQLCPVLECEVSCCLADTTENRGVHVCGVTGIDNIECILQPELFKCKTIGYVLGLILLNSSITIDTMFLDSNYTSDKSESVVLQNVNFTPNKKVVITCHIPCFIHIAVTIFCRYFYSSLSLVFQNISFISSSLSVQNVQVHFKHVLLENTFVSDISPRPGEFGQIALWFTNVLFTDTQSVLFGDQSALNINKTYTCSCYFTKSSMNHVSITLNSTITWVSLSYTTFAGESIFAMNSETVFLDFAFVLFSCIQDICLDIQAGKIAAKFANFTLQFSQGGIRLFCIGTQFQILWIELDILNSTFQNNSLHGPGGTVQILFKIDWFKAESHVLISDSLFINNVLVQVGEIDAFGGAISIVSFHSITNAQSGIEIKVEKSQFVDNQAESGGGAIYFVGSSIFVLIDRCEFVFSNASDSTDAGVFILGHSATCIVRTTLNNKVISQQESLIKLNSHSIGSSIKCLDLGIKCAAWHKLKIRSQAFSATGNETILRKLKLYCKGCAESYYFPSDGSYSLFYSQGNSIPSTKDKKCLKCPDGGECTGHELIAKPNFWGQNTSNRVKFEQCPTDYCCSGTQTNPCTSYNSCSGKREGTLCCCCQTGFSQCLLSNTCMPNQECTASWFWGLAVVASIMYMVWYTFKDDVMSIPGSVVDKIKCFALPNTVQPKLGNQEVIFIEKGYFGILIYFVQATAVLRSDLPQYSSGKIHDALKRIETYLGLSLTIELSYLPVDICPTQNLNATTKMLIKFMFLLSIFCSWLFMSVLVLCAHILTQHTYKKDVFSFSEIKTKLIGGLVKIVKYTYAGFSRIVFVSLLCVEISRDSVWFHDASVPCFSDWQKVMILFGICYIVPFPLTLFLGIYCLKKGKLSGNMLLAATFCPLPFLFAFLLVSLKTSTMPHNSVGSLAKEETWSMNENDRKMCKRFMRGYRDEGVAQYWECVMFCRRLLLNFTFLTSNVLLKQGIGLVLCNIFLVHHVYVQPFVNQPPTG